MIAPVRWLFWVCCAVAVSGGCTKPNPNACCTNEAECLALGSDELRPCDGGEVCSANSCVPVQCETGDQCSGATPYCVNQLCVGSCQVEADCEGVPGAPICAADRVCVGCRDNADCSGTTPICDAEDRKCRGCEADGDCASGICLEADGVCAAESEVVFVVPGRSDTGDCTKLAPCGTLEYALPKTLPPRTTIRIDGGQQLLIGSTLGIGSRRLTIDSSGTALSYDGPAGTAMFNIASSGEITFEGLRLVPDSQDFVAVQSGTLRLHRVSIDNVQDQFRSRFLRVGSGSHLLLMLSDVDHSNIECSGSGLVTIDRSMLVGSKVVASDCTVSVKMNTFVDNQEVISLLRGTSLSENNLFMATNELADVLLILEQRPGSRFAFNTVVNVTGIPSEGVALNCDSGLRTENNIFAHRSTGPHLAGCTPRYSLYDDTFLSPPGDGNRSAPFDMLFINPSARDFRPSMTSLARGMSEPGAAISIDHAGKVRPQPAGTRPDVGAFEVP